MQSLNLSRALMRRFAHVESPHLTLPRRRPITCSTNALQFHHPAAATAAVVRHPDRSTGLLHNFSRSLSAKPPPPADKKDQKDEEKRPNAAAGEGGPEEDPWAEMQKLGLFARFKKMYKEYWYVLLPVHLFTSCCWLGGFYYASKSGVDIVSMLQSIGLSEKIIHPLRDSSLGHLAVAYLLYKIATPARYTVTLGGTTYAIKRLVAMGVIKPVPTRAELLQRLQEKKENLQNIVQDTKSELQERKQNIADDLKKYKDELKSVREKTVSGGTKEK